MSDEVGIQIRNAIYFVGVMIIFSVASIWVNIKNEVEEAKSEYKAVKTEIGMFVKETRDNISQDRKAATELLKRWKIIDEKIVTMKRDRGRYVISVEEKQKKEENQNESQ